MATHNFYISKDFSKYPFGRFKKNSETSAESLRDDYLKPLLEQYERLVIHLDIVDNGGRVHPSFRDEAFGGLVRENILSINELWRISFVSNDSALLAECYADMYNAAIIRVRDSTQRLVLEYIDDPKVVTESWKSIEGKYKNNIPKMSLENTKKTLEEAKKIIDKVM